MTSIARRQDFYNIIFCWICTKMIQKTKGNCDYKITFLEKHISFGGLSLQVLGLPLCTFSHVSYFKHFTQETSVSTKHVYNLHFKKLDNSLKIIKAPSFQQSSICIVTKKVVQREQSVIIRSFERLLVFMKLQVDQKMTP